jgi:hypothetical protein
MNMENEELEIREEEKPNLRDITRSMLGDAIVDLIISGDKTIKDLFKQRDLTFVVTGKEDSGHMSFVYHDDRIFVRIPSDACTIEGLDFKEIIYKTEYATSNFIRKAINDKSDVAGEAIEESFELNGNPTLKIKDFSAVRDIKEKEEDKKEEAGHEHKENEEAELNISTYDKNIKYEYHDTEFSLDEVTQKELDSTGFKADKPMFKDFTRINAMANKLLKSFKGYMGKEAKINPTRKMKNRAICSDYAEKIYISKKAKGGKKLENINFLIDMSGSMLGEPSKNMVEILLVFNRIAQQGYLTGTIFYSETYNRCKIQLPTQDSVINSIYKTGGCEGLAATMKNYIDIIKDSNILFCITDGQITDTPLDKRIYSKYKFKTVGVYVNKNAKDLTEYTGSLNRWFDISIVRRSVPELIDKLVALGLRTTH